MKKESTLDEIELLTDEEIENLSSLELLVYYELLETLEEKLLKEENSNE
jgi:hypothetical protein